MVVDGMLTLSLSMCTNNCKHSPPMQILQHCALLGTHVEVDDFGRILPRTRSPDGEDFACAILGIDADRILLLSVCFARVPYQLYALVSA